MTLKITWSPQSDEDIKRIADYLLEEWGAKVAMSFIDEVESSLFLISSFLFLIPDLMSISLSEDVF